MKNELNHEVGSRIRNLREYANYTREFLAEKADISVQFLADIETGRKSMTIKTLRSIASALHVSTDYIVYGNIPSDQNDPTPSNLVLMLQGLSPSEQKYAEEILKVFIDALAVSKEKA